MKLTERLFDLLADGKEAQEEERGNRNARDGPDSERVYELEWHAKHVHPYNAGQPDISNPSNISQHTYWLLVVRMDRSMHNSGDSPNMNGVDAAGI